MLQLWPLAGSATTNAPATLCAWCLKEQDRPMGDGSHGICQRHAQKIRDQAQARRDLREQQQGEGRA